LHFKVILRNVSIAHEEQFEDTKEVIRSHK